MALALATSMYACVKTDKDGQNISYLSNDHTYFCAKSGVTYLIVGPYRSVSTLSLLVDQSGKPVPCEPQLGEVK